MENLEDLGMDTLSYLNAQNGRERRDVEDSDQATNQFAEPLRAATTSTDDRNNGYAFDSGKEDMPPSLVNLDRKQATRQHSSRLRKRAPKLKIAEAQAGWKYFYSPAATPTSKQDSRPSLSRLRESLELTTEAFLQLQAAAKRFMLNEDHPERLECVASRGQADTAMSKLKLHQCVSFFLDQEGNGATFFSADRKSDIGEQPRLSWPACKDKIIIAVTPLLRRMVTNERQRQYALETRNADLRRNSNEPSPSMDPSETTNSIAEIAHLRDDDPLSATQTLHKIKQICELPEDRWQILLGSVRYQISLISRRSRVSHSFKDMLADLLVTYADASSWDIHAQEDKAEACKTIMLKIWTCCSVLSACNPNQAVLESDQSTGITLIVSVSIQGTTHPHFLIDATTFSDLTKLLQTVRQCCQTSTRKRKRQLILKALLPGGLVKLESEAVFKQALETVRDTQWMDDELRITVDV